MGTRQKKTDISTDIFVCKLCQTEKGHSVCSKQDRVCFCNVCFSVCLSDVPVLSVCLCTCLFVCRSCFVCFSCLSCRSALSVCLFDRPHVYLSCMPDTLAVGLHACPSVLSCLVLPCIVLSIRLSVCLFFLSVCPLTVCVMIKANRQTMKQTCVCMPCLSGCLFFFSACLSFVLSV